MDYISNLSTGNITIDIILIIAFIAATGWYVASVSPYIYYKFKKKEFTIYEYDESNEDATYVNTIKSRKMNYAILDQLYNHSNNPETLQFKSLTEYNEFVMVYSIKLDGEERKYLILSEVFEVVEDAA